MERFARIVAGYHGCEQKLANGLLTGKIPIADWNKSENAYDWLGEGIYFWEHSPGRALRWAIDRFQRRAAVIGAVIQLGTCFDLLDEQMAGLLSDSYPEFEESFKRSAMPLPVNRGTEHKLRELDCAVINDCVRRMGSRGIAFDTVRGAFLEGDPVFPGTTISSQTHIQLAVRSVDCILGVFRPNL